MLLTIRFEDKSRKLFFFIVINYFTKDSRMFIQ